MYCLHNGHNYIGTNLDNTPTSVTNIDRALLFADEKKAKNYLGNLKMTLRKFDWKVKKLKQEDKTKDKDSKNDEIICEYCETELEKSNFDISEFLCHTIKTMSQLRDYARNMDVLEQEYNKKILDVRHYIRDENVKLNAVQMQRIGYFLQKLERERYECKSNRTIAEIFLSDFNNLENITYINEIKNVKESKYRPKVFSYELLDEITGRRSKNE